MNTLMRFDQWLAALCIWREARGAGEQAWNAIWWVINNRSQDPQRRWPRTVVGVIEQHAQFSSMTNLGDADLVAWPVEPTPPQNPGADWVAFQGICESVVTVAPIGTDPTGGAVYYESYPAPPDATKMPWFDLEKLTVTIGRIRFYRS